MKSMCKHWGLHISTDINCLEVVLDSFWAVWRGLLLSLELKFRSWRFPRYWWFNKRYHGGYQLICLISRPLLIASRCDWYRSKGLLKGFKLALRPWESSNNWWRYDQMKFVTDSWATSIKSALQSCFLWLYVNGEEDMPTVVKSTPPLTNKTSKDYKSWKED